MSSVFEIWRDSLSRLLFFYEAKRGSTIAFFPKLFLFFILLNILCFWWALLTAFSFLIEGSGSYYFKLQVPVGFFGALFDAVSFFVTIFIVRRALRTRSNSEYVGHLSLDLVIAVLSACWVLFVFSFSGWLIHRLEAEPPVIIEAPAKPQPQTEKTKLQEPPKSAVAAVEKPPVAEKPPVPPKPPPRPETPKPQVREESSTSEKPRSLGGRTRAYHEMLTTALANPGQNLRYIYFGAIMGASASLPTCIHIYMFLASLVRFISRRSTANK